MRLLITGTHHVRPRRTPPRYRQIVTGAAMLLLPMFTTGCHTWKVQPVNPGQASQWSRPIRVTLVSGELLTLDGARVTSDTLFGAPRAVRGAQTATVLALPMREVRAIDERVFSGDRTAGVVVGSVPGALALLVAAVFVALASWDGY